MAENWAAVGWFLDVDDLFDVHGHWFKGLDIKAIYYDAQMSGRSYTPDDYAKLRILGKTAAAELNKKNNNK
ncbi:hypothetical protein IT774_05155 [Salinimonas marina]|uniref:Uncharacterized protein n=1 Tax=Salinimonas marina TaxID=2785918 RepID=A0A7S9HE28_9ALTE|nr:hypothetical protein [Salinimonas marina]QPG06562.1 hypothetical protein IT774_05155 [Salinimonas marina]